MAKVSRQAQRVKEPTELPITTIYACTSGKTKSNTTNNTPFEAHYGRQFGSGAPTHRVACPSRPAPTWRPPQVARARTRPPRPAAVAICSVVDGPQPSAQPASRRIYVWRALKERCNHFRKGHVRWVNIVHFELVAALEPATPSKPICVPSHTVFGPHRERQSATTYFKPQV